MRFAKSKLLSEANRIGLRFNFAEFIAYSLIAFDIGDIYSSKSRTDFNIALNTQDSNGAMGLII
ncbi:hypothetical protein FJZ31_12585 [Candidatus Poribacteria bacterium]|nr:hypothetical protein [Candidatus Poribacteria bacterium]